MRSTYRLWYLIAGLLLLTPVGVRMLALHRAHAVAAASASDVRAGEVLFLHDWQPGDSLSPSGDGLGPVFNATSCVACHHQGGTGGSGGLEHNVTNFRGSVRDPLFGERPVTSPVAPSRQGTGAYLRRRRYSGNAPGCSSRSAQDRAANAGATGATSGPPKFTRGEQQPLSPFPAGSSYFAAEYARPVRGRPDRRDSGTGDHRRRASAAAPLGNGSGEWRGCPGRSCPATGGWTRRAFRLEGTDGHPVGLRAGGLCQRTGSEQSQPGATATSVDAQLPDRWPRPDRPAVRPDHGLPHGASSGPVERTFPTRREPRRQSRPASDSLPQSAVPTATGPISARSRGCTVTCCSTRWEPIWSAAAPTVSCRNRVRISSQAMARQRTNGARHRSGVSPIPLPICTTAGLRL